ncbi:hypothetical protein ASPWEDRAFT_35448 [Aspergillus wentii DTO 134E9]|uniref:Uncharacterized protein n=1 Tax=Aspergillus wentii DTO 134E9 TaxID=1073089 RepID=A0A1L9S3U3_ASPWE|nr:uncharacterized protein ASPWEDRAFT_35448 [Aspergillus wentii DTO 134E9]OJJ41836.1 hypothetical protein ASPWEDRAFT_35448 [Aspergillus wentii DTO 134E9]
MPMITNFVYIIGMRQLPEEWIVDQAIYVSPGHVECLCHIPYDTSKRMHRDWFVSR